MGKLKDTIIAKPDLVDGAEYEGTCRNADRATWNEQEQCFYYMRTKFGFTFPESIRHPEDDDGFDLFYPTKRID